MIDSVKKLQTVSGADFCRLIFAFLLAFIVVLHAGDCNSQVLKKKQEALQEVFAEADTVERRTFFLTEKQVSEISDLAKAPVQSKLAHAYIGLRDNKLIGVVFFETNVVRTKPETFMVAVNADGQVSRVEMLAFYEPMDYLPVSKWFRLFDGKLLTERLWPKRQIHNVTGATLTVRAVAQGVRKALATYQVIFRNQESLN